MLKESDCLTASYLTQYYFEKRCLVYQQPLEGSSDDSGATKLLQYSLAILCIHPQQLARMLWLKMHQTPWLWGAPRTLHHPPEHCWSRCFSGCSTPSSLQSIPKHSKRNIAPSSQTCWLPHSTETLSLSNCGGFFGCWFFVCWLVGWLGWVWLGLGLGFVLYFFYKLSFTWNGITLFPAKSISNRITES